MLSKQEMHPLIHSGRVAIEYSMLAVLLRSHPLSPADDAELKELHTLIDLYNKWMKQYELPDIIHLNASNDDINPDNNMGDNN
jgi:hypothetical protein